MAPRGAPSPGRRRPPISPAASPACPARLRRGALRGGRRMRGPAGTLLLICPCFPLSGRPQDDGVSQFSLCPARPGRGWAAPGPIPGQGSARLRAASFCLPVSFWFGSRMPPPPAPAELSRHRPRWSLRGSLRKASGRSAAARSPGVRPSAARGERVRRGGPRAGARRGEGEGKGRGRGRSVAGRGAASTAAPPPPSPPLPQPAPPPPRSAPPPRGGPLEGPQSLWLEHSPARTRFGWGSSYPNSPWLLPNLPRPRRPLIPAPLSADPRPQLLTPVWAKSCTALCPRPRPWLVGGRRGPGRRAERCAGLGTRPGDGGDARSLQCAS